jgi:hypothetical protein
LAALAKFLDDAGCRPSVEKRASYPARRERPHLMSNHDNALWLRNGVAQRARAAKSLQLAPHYRLPATF